MIDALLKDLRNSGIKLYVEGNKLKYIATKGIMANQYRESINNNRKNIISYLNLQKEDNAFLDGYTRY